jgi:hypothetical protein
MRPVSSHSFQYIDSDLPVGMTLHAWRRRNATPAASRTRRPRLRLRVRFA